jgi:DNA polymerase-3 subunit epsilon
MLITIVDVETTGLDPDTAQVAEIAAILYDTDAGCVLQQCSTLLQITDNPAYHINKIALSDASGLAYSQANLALEMFQGICEECDYITAYNWPFDRAFVEELTGMDFSKMSFDAQLFPWQHHKASPSLVDLCIAYGVPVVRAHRALDDCQLLAELIGRLPDIDAAIDYAQQPRVVVKALVSYDDRHLASNAGFAWNKPYLAERAWAKRLPLSEVESLRGALPFDVEVAGE